jgi:FixJ family two-component response regulator
MAAIKAHALGQAPSREEPMNTQGSVFIVDDAREIRLALTCMLNVAGYRAYAFESAERFLDQQDFEAPGCLLLDIGLPGMSGIDLQRSLVGSKLARPIIFLTGQGDIKTSVQAMKLGAVDYLTKPVDDTRLFTAVDQAIRLDVTARRERAICEAVQQRLQELTRRERGVLELVIRGLLNKQIAAKLGIGEKTVKLHRYRAMRKMNVNSVPSLIRLVAHAGIQPEFPAIDTPVAYGAGGKSSPVDVRRRPSSPEIRESEAHMFA